MDAEIRRLPAIDWMRGLVVVVMAIDHVGSVFDPGHLGFQSDSPAAYFAWAPALSSGWKWWSVEA